MKNAARLFAVALFAVAGFSVASSPRIETPTTYAEGGAPVPWCWPDDPGCTPPPEEGKTTAPPKHTVTKK